MKSYNGLAQIYDKTIEVDYSKWTSFLTKYFSEKGKELKGKKLLELGCGTGNMTLCMREKGMEVLAIDLSQEMLQAAMEKAIKKRQKIMFIHQDMTSFEINKKFEYVFSFCDAYNYITAKEGLEDSFKRVINHLQPDGYFVFDISTKHKLSNIIGNNTYTTNEEELCYIWDNYYEADTAILEMYISFFVLEGNLYKRINEHHVQRAWENHFLIQQLEKVGFREIEVYDDYSFNNVDENSTRAVFICKK